MPKTIFYAILVFVSTWCADLRAEVMTYRHGDTIELSCVASAQPVPGSLRALVLVNETKLSIKGTWDTEVLDLVQNGNTVRVALKQPKVTPIGVLGSSGVYYYIVVKPVASEHGAGLSPVIQVIGDPGVAGEKEKGRGNDADPSGRAGGAWEHHTNTWIRLHKHIRGGRVLPNVVGKQEYNEEILRTERRRVPGRVWTQMDDFQTLEYYSWTLNNVTAHYIGVRYLGELESGEFRYLQHQTDQTIALWHQRHPDDPNPLRMVDPVIPILRGREEFFLLYTLDAP